MTTEKHLYLSTSTQETAHVTSHHRSAVCGCGQDLDYVAGHHCPRCGTTLAQAA